MAQTGERSVSVVIVSWNTRAHLAACLASVARESAARAGDALEVFVVDNASTDGSVEMVAREHGWVRLIANDCNFGFARANNQALQHCTGAFVLLLNPDCELREQALPRLLDFMLANEDAGVAGPQLLNSDGSTQESRYPFPTLGREFVRLFHLDRVAGRTREPERPVHVDCVKGACMLLRTRALAATGPFDEDYFLYSEEIDLCHRMRAQGFATYWVPDAAVVHHGGKSTEQSAAAMFLQLYRSKVLYFRKHHGDPTARRYKAILALAALCRLALVPLALLEPRQRRQRHLRLGLYYWRLLGAVASF